jgi:hypothetical protein
MAARTLSAASAVCRRGRAACASRFLTARPWRPAAGSTSSSCAPNTASAAPLCVKRSKCWQLEGLVTMKVRRGAYVTEMSRDDVAQVYHLLALLESDAVPGEVAASARATSQRAELRTLHDRPGTSRCASATPSSPPTRLSTTSLLDLAGNRWRDADRHRPAQGDEAQPPPLAAQAGPAGKTRWPSTACHHSRRIEQRNAARAALLHEGAFQQRPGSRGLSSHSISNPTRRHPTKLLGYSHFCKNCACPMAASSA